jgi:hypothetical protein
MPQRMTCAMHAQKSKCCSPRSPCLRQRGLGNLKHCAQWTTRTRPKRGPCTVPEDTTPRQLLYDQLVDKIPLHHMDEVDSRSQDAMPCKAWTNFVKTSSWLANDAKAPRWALGHLWSLKPKVLRPVYE